MDIQVNHGQLLSTQLSTVNLASGGLNQKCLTNSNIKYHYYLVKTNKVYKQQHYWVEQTINFPSLYDSIKF